MKIERVISWFNISSEELQGEYNVDNIELDILKEIFTPKVNDQLLYDPYSIGEKEAIQLQNYIDFDFDFSKFLYQLDCFKVD